KSVRFDRLLASTALGLVLVLSSHPGMAQQSPDTAQPAPPAKDIGAPSPAASPATDATIPTSAPPKPAMLASGVADSDVVDKLREAVTGKLDRIVNRKADREGVQAFYSARNYAPLWVNGSAASERAKSAIAYLAKADAVGLDPRDYPTPDFTSAVTAEAMADAE